MVLTALSDRISQDGSRRMVSALSASSAEDDVGVISAMADVEIVDTSEQWPPVPVHH